jgi:hypothetical protein
MNLRKFFKYRYLGNVIPKIPISWESHILDLLKTIDKVVKPRYVPRFLLNHSKIVYISSIKQHFGTLRVSIITDNEEVKQLVKTTEQLCNQTCERCGQSPTEIVTVKNWISNLCPPCIKILK